MKKFKFYGVDNNCYKLNDVIWEAIEDESDGYRSYLSSIEVSKKEGLIFFPMPIAEVYIEKIEDDGFQLVDTENRHIWLKVYTDDRDNYYPYFRFDYTPDKTLKPDGSRLSKWEAFLEED